MASRGRGRRGRPRGTGQASPTFDQPPVFDQQAFAEAVGIAAAAVAQANVAGSLGGPSNLQRFRVHHPPTFTGRGDPMVADHWFIQIENILETMEITSDTTRIRLAAFQLKGKARVWWRWARTSRDLEVMTWVEFQELFMGKYFQETAKHAKAQEFLELRQGAMTVMDYVARFTKLARFADDYVATDLAKVRRFENGLKLSIRARIVGLRLRNMDSMVGTALTIEREIEDARNTRDAGVGSKKEDQPSSSSGKRQKTSASHEFQDQGQDWAVGQAGQVICYFCRQPGHVRQDCPQRQGSQDFGTAQSQLAVEHVQFIPPHPSTGQRNQFQFQSAIRAPSAAQVGQRSQRVGRGQVQDSQAETSSQAGQTIWYFCRQPGHMRRECPRRQRSHGVEAKHTEQPDMEGTFLLLHLLTRVAFTLDASY